MFWGNFITALIIVSVASIIDLDNAEAGAYFQITNNKALKHSMVHSSDLIKSFLRYSIVRKKEEAAKKLIIASGIPITKVNLAKLDAGTNKAEFVMRQRAKRFREVNSALMMSASQVPIDTLIQSVFNTVDKQLQGMKDSVFTSSEMEDLLSDVEGNQKKIELQLEELRTKNRNLLATFGLQMPSDQAFAAINA